MRCAINTYSYSERSELAFSSLVLLIRRSRVRIQPEGGVTLRSPVFPCETGLLCVSGFPLMLTVPLSPLFVHVLVCPSRCGVKRSILQSAFSASSSIRSMMSRMPVPEIIHAAKYEGETRGPPFIHRLPSAHPRCARGRGSPFY